MKSAARNSQSAVNTLRRCALAALAAAALVGCQTGRVSTEGEIVVPLFSAENWTPRPGDLLFQDLDGSPFCDAVEAVTQGWHGAALTHVGLVARDANGAPVVIEALTKGVVETPLAEFLARSRDDEGRPKVLVGRLRVRHEPLIPAAIAAARQRLGRPYDDAFDIGNDAYYCSELIHLAFQEANGGQPLFALEPMTFRDPRTGETFPVWVEYFEKLGAPIPEGAPGLNPGGLSRAEEIQIIGAYGRPAGLAARLAAPPPLPGAPVPAPSVAAEPSPSDAAPTSPPAPAEPAVVAPAVETAP